MYRGLSSKEAKRKLSQQGANELPTKKNDGFLQLVKDVVTEPMFLLLAVCGSLYILIGSFQEGVILLSTVFIIISITVFQRQKTENALHALQELASPRALVIRDGKELRIPGRELVAQDIVLLFEGDRIPADGQLIECNGLEVNESILTGESLPVAKSLEETRSAVYSGTLVTKGQAVMTVTKTGQKSKIGTIGKSLLGIHASKTPLQTEMKKLIRNLGIIAIVVSVAITFIFFIQRGQFIPSMLSGLATAMALIPEEFPVILTVFLTLGAWRLTKINVLTRNPSVIETLGSATILCSDKTGTITQNKMAVASIANKFEIIPENTYSHPTNLLLLSDAKMACSIDSRDPMDKALLAFGANKIERLKLIDELLFSHDHLLTIRSYADERNKKQIHFCKGAPEAVLAKCIISETEKNQLERLLKTMASNGLRIIAFAKGNSDLHAKVNYKTIQLEIVGLIGFADPVRKEVKQAVADCRSAGIKIVMITGDYPKTAANIGHQIGLNANTILTGNDIDKLGNNALKKALLSTEILARVSPQHKLRVVEALKKNKEIVAMTGDGVNDAPSLKAAHIGISMGNKGTDVAREASSLVLLDDNFASIVKAIRLGRKISDNLQKAMSYVLAIHIPIIGLAISPAFSASFPLLLLPIHIVFMELIIDPMSSIGFETEKEEINIMTRPPRDSQRSFFGKKEIFSSIAEGLVFYLFVLAIYLLTVHSHGNQKELRCIVFTGLILSNLFFVLSKLSKTENVFRILLFHNMTAKAILLVAFILLFLTIRIPVISALFGFEFPGYYHFLVPLIASLLFLTLLELHKKWKNKKLSEVRYQERNFLKKKK